MSDAARGLVVVKLDKIMKQLEDHAELAHGERAFPELDMTEDGELIMPYVMKVEEQLDMILKYTKDME